MCAALVCLARAGAARNACALLTRKNLGFVRTTETRSTRDGIVVSQCFYELPSFTDSVSVTVMHGKEAKGYWKARIAGEHEQQIVDVDGVGDDAIWSGNQRAGALYVLDGDVILRLSLGGAGSVEKKIERGKFLAVRAIKRVR